MGSKQLNVGIIGLNAERGWASVAHVPALRALGSDYVLAGVANSSLESAAAAAKIFGIPHVFAAATDLIASPEIDVVAVTVKTPHHYGIVKSALESGKALYCEWPLGNGLQEAEELTGLAESVQARTVIGLQGCVAPAVEELRRLVNDGFVGQVLSTSIVGVGGPWGAVTDAASAYALDRRNGTTLLSISAGHALAALQYALGDVVEVRAVMAQRRQSSRIAESGADCPMTSPDQVVVAGLLDAGAPLSIHLRGGGARGVGFTWEVNGTDGDLQLTAPVGQIQLAPLTLRGARGIETELRLIEPPPDPGANWPKGARPGNVARLYAKAVAGFRGRASTGPDFVHAVRLHRLLAAIEASGESGRCMVRGHDARWAEAD